MFVCLGFEEWEERRILLLDLMPFHGSIVNFQLINAFIQEQDILYSRFSKWMQKIVLNFLLFDILFFIFFCCVFVQF